MSSLENLKKRIYKKDEKFLDRERKDPFFFKNHENVKKEWENPSFNNPEEILITSGEYLNKMKNKKKERNIFLIIFSFVFVIALSGFFAYNFFIRGGGIGFLSSQNINIKIGGPSSVNAGEKLTLPIVIKNNNKVDLKNLDIIIEYPKGSEIISKESNFPLKEKRKVGDILAGQEKDELFETLIFGEENSSQNIKITIEYRLADSSAIFEKSIEKIIQIAKPAVSIFIEAPQEASFGKEINFKIDAISNTSLELSNMVLDVEYPEGFEFIDSDPIPQDNKTRFILGNIASGEKKTVSIKGKMGNKNSAPEEFINTTLGSLNNKNELTVYSKKTYTLSVKKPFLNISFKNEDNKSYFVSRPGEDLKFVLDWENNLSVGIKNAIIEARIENGEEFFNLPNLQIDNNGEYRSFDNTIVWDSPNYFKFSYIEPGEKGSVSFSIDFKDQPPFTKEKNKNFNVSLSAKFFTKYSPEEYENIDIFGNDKISIRLVSDFQFTQDGFYYLGPFKNSGPIPPKAEKETTYTIKWSLVNSSNDLSNVSISAVLPIYVKWINKTYSKTNLGIISYNEENREVKWTINNLKAGVGINFPAEEYSFQILFLPSKTQIGENPILINKAEAKAFDQFVNANLEDSYPAVTTSLSKDSKIGNNEGIVRE